MCKCSARVRGVMMELYKRGRLAMFVKGGGGGKKQPRRQEW